MAKIKFVKDTTILTASKEISLMKQLLAAGRPVASSCGGEGVCGKCRVLVSKGQENLSIMSDLEEKCLERNQLDKNKYRLSCQAFLSGDVEVDTEYW